MVLQLTSKVMDFIVGMYEKGSITKKESGMPNLKFYGLCWHLRDNNIAEAQTNNESNEKIWKLTDRGKQIAEHLKAIKEIVNA